MTVLSSCGSRQQQGADGGHPFFSLCFGAERQPCRWPVFRPAMPLLSTSARGELWQGPEPAEHWEPEAGIRAVRSGQLLMMAASHQQDADESLEQLTSRLYRRLRRALKRAGFQHVIRFWNFVPAINATENGMERYRRFCIGRHEAFSGDWPLDEATYPAASAVGSASGPLEIHALAAPTPGSPLENPRQVSAYHYPSRYGPRSPAFARASFVESGDGGTLFISGTAAIVEHRSVHPMDAAAQTREAVANLRALVEHAEARTARRLPLLRENTALRIYVRNAEDTEAVQQTLDREFPDRLPAVFVQADICRRELLVEIEGSVQSV
jgi:chorismate lyase/3-hydroxybenzoate synthase